MKHNTSLLFIALAAVATNSRPDATAGPPQSAAEKREDSSDFNFPTKRSLGSAKAATGST